MTVLWLPGPPAPEEEAWPTLGPQVIAFMEEYLVFGPGDLLGEPYRLSPEQKGLVSAMYEVYPDDHELAGRRRYKRAVLSLAKGLAKTELAAAIAICELHAAAPVRTVGFDGLGRPIGGPVTFPYIPMLATTEEQADDLAYGAARHMIENSALRDDFDVGLDRIIRLDGGGEMRSLASAPNARDGARTTFEHFDETHRFILPRIKSAHQTMLNNIPKRLMADAWGLETTTSFAPGEGSVAEAAYEYARKVEAGQLTPDRTFFYFHRQASDHHDLRTRDGRMAAVKEASGPHGGFRDLESVVNLWDSPDVDKAYYERVWCNRPVQQERKAFDLEQWDRQARPKLRVETGAQVVIAFDGSRFGDSTSLSARELVTGHSWSLGLWEKPQGPEGDDWEVPEDQVDAAVAAAFAEYDVWRMYCDPPHWRDAIARWAGRYGEKRVIEWWTDRRKAMVHAVKAFEEALRAGTITHDGNPAVRRHIGNACKVMTHFRDENDQPLWYISKERPDSPFKIDASMTEIITNLGRNDAIAAGVIERKQSVYESRGVRRV